MPLKNSTVYNVEAIRIFTIFNTIKNKTIRIFLTVLFGGFGVATCIFGIVVAGITSIYTVFALLLVGLLLVLVYRWFFAPVVRYKKDETSQNIAVNYEFYPRDFVARSVRVSAKGNTATRYSVLESVYETEKYIYLYINKMNAFIVLKSSFSDGGAALLDLLKREVDDGKLHLQKKKKA